MNTYSRRNIIFFICITVCLITVKNGTAQRNAVKNIVFIAGPPSHGKGEHEFKGGCTLLANDLNRYSKDIHAVVYDAEWPADSTVLAKADAVVIYCDGGGGHIAIPHLEEVDKLKKKGVGLVLLHYAVEVPKGKPGNYFLKWAGGYFETYWSVNPFWNAMITNLPTHEITRGVKPFEANDEWYYHMRFTEGKNKIIPVLTTLPPKSSLNRPDGSHENNAFARADIDKGIPQTLAWAFETAGSRSFSFTGGHTHNNWMNDNFRKLVLNAIMWTAKGKIPAGGITSPTPTQSELDSLLNTSK